MRPRRAESQERKGMAGERTRQKLIQTGVEIFGRYNFEATTTRMLADSAGVNLASIPYHFKSKEGLYHAVVHHIVEQATAAYRSPVAEISETLRKVELFQPRVFRHVIQASEHHGLNDARHTGGQELGRDHTPGANGADKRF